MCGICGEINFAESASSTLIEKMLHPLRRRGPNAQGALVHHRIGFGHRRLSILDLSATAQQPMVDPHLGLSIVFNGCIYNFLEIRRVLINKGYRFFSQGDTEVILKAYAEWGERCVDHLHGMFAFAIWERDSGRVMLARDRLGIKPLYLAETNKGLRFASTLPALVAGGDIDTTVDDVALHHYLSWHAVVPAPRTILRAVRKLPPGTFLVVEPDGTRRERTYWDFSVGVRDEDRPIAEEEWTERVLSELTNAVDRRRVSDVPMGVLLSGGLDSSLLVALLAKIGHSEIRTFSIGFETLAGIPGNEFKYSQLIADHFQTNHEQILIPAREIAEALPATIAAMSEPMVSHDAVAFYLLSREVAKHVRVVQSGQGADEVFGGYHWHQALRHSNDLVEDYQKHYFDRDHAELQEVLEEQHLNGDVSREFVSDFFKGATGDSVDKVLQLDTQVMLVDDPVKRVDNMTMAWGLECRVPFLDHKLVELAARIPSGLKVAHGGKYILKEAARQALPDDVIDRPKGYFPVPALKHLEGPVLDYVKTVLTDRRSRERGIFKRTYVDHLLKDPNAAMTPKGHSKLWQIAALECWLQAHVS